MRRYHYATMTAQEQATVFERSVADIFAPALVESVRGLIEDVRQRGDDALVDALRVHDGIDLIPDRLLVSEAELDAAKAKIPQTVHHGIAQAIANVRRYNERVLDRVGGTWLEQLSNGCYAGEQNRPISSAGLYVPCRKGSFPSVLIQIGVPALVAGVPEITLVVPPVPGRGGEVDAATLVVARSLGLTRIVRSNGVAGIAALAVGTQSVPKVNRITGPGSPAVTAAQIAVQLYGVQVDMLFGPSETMILADESADPLRVALDLLTEAEHGTDSAAILVTPSEELAQAVDEESERILARLPEQRREFARSSTTKYGGIIIVRDLTEGVSVVNRYAPEHLQIATQEPLFVLGQITDAAEILLGQDTPNVAANYSLGTPATLPTGGFARSCSGVTAQTYLKRSSVAYLNHTGLANLAPGVLALAEHEGFPAHMAALLDRGFSTPTAGETRVS